MATECTDEDWERSEEALKTLQIEPQLADQALFFSNPEDVTGDGPEGVINPALIDALQNPRERMNVLKYEDRILRFVKSSDSFLDVPPISNSYQRLLIYRVAERFALEHNPSEISNEAGDRGIIFFKTQRTTVPSVLLINYKGEEIKMESSISASAPPNPSKGPKIVVMQRRPNSSNINPKSNSSNEKNQISAVEKEKAYAAARARIFGEESLTESAELSAEPTPSPSQRLRAQAPSFTAKADPVQQPPKQKQSPSPEFENGQDPMRDSGATGNQKKKVVNVGAWKEKKVVLRDKQADRYDPDFARLPSGQNAPSPLSCPPYQPPPLITPQFTPSLHPVYPSNLVMHQPPSTIAPTLSSSSQMSPSMHWNPSGPMGNPPHWDRHQAPVPHQHLQQQGGFSPYDYQRHGHAMYPTPPNYQPGSLPQQGIPVAPGLPDHLTRAPPSGQPFQASYNKDFPPLA